MLSKDLIARIRKIEIRTRRMVEDITAGAYHSVFKGSGIEFEDVREYTQDDDVRDIDWNVTAKMGTPYIKKYVEELTKGTIEYDKRFVYYLLAATGICVVPLTSFFTPLLGFRMTLLDKDVDEFEHVVKTIASKITEYINSSK